MPAVSAPFAGKFSALGQRFFSWQSLGAALLGVVLAKWTWLLLAPASRAMPPAAWEASDDAGRLFGTARAAEAAPMSNIKLIGVFAHRTRGFAVLLVDEKQIGVAQGEEVKPGMRLVETHADHVVLEQAGVRQRVDMTGAAAPSGAAAIVTAPAAPESRSPEGAAASVPPGQIEALQRQFDAMGNAPSEQREALKRKLDNMRGQH